MTETATVELLTAEVRVLMVGSRQVTLSVARQLDFADPQEIEPFGRIRTGQKLGFAITQQIEVIGSLRGNLARSEIGCERQWCDQGRNPGDWAHLDALNAITGRCNKHREVGVHFRSHSWLSWDDDDLASSWRALPLIVLAGLK